MMFESTRRRHVLAAISAGALLPRRTSAATSSELVAVQVAAFTGPTSYYAGQLAGGMRAAFNARNTARRPGDPAIKLVTADDESRPEKTVELYRKLAQKHKPIAFMYPLGLEPVDTLLKKRIPEELGVPVLGVLPALSINRTDPHAFRVGVGEVREAETLFDHMRSVGITQIGLTMWDTPPSREMLPVLESNWKLRGLQATAVLVPPNGKVDIPSTVTQLLVSEPQAICCLLPVNEAAVLVRELRGRGRKAAVYGLSLLESRLLWALAGSENARGVVLSQYVPNPFSPRRRIVAQYQSDLRLHAPEASISSYSLEGYIAARILLEAIKRAGNSPDAALVRSTLERLQGFDLGDLPVNFTPSNHIALQHIDISVVSDGGKLVY